MRLLKVAIPLPTMGMSCAMARAEVRFAAARRDGRGKKWSRCARNTGIIPLLPSAFAMQDP